MRIAAASSDGDLTTRARLRNSAIEVFAARGLDASVREIAAHAGVSAGLVTHHFGSKEKLREECDSEVLRQYRMVKSGGTALSPTQAIAELAGLEEYAPMFVYMLRSVRDGGSVGTHFLSRMVEETIAFTEEGVAAGLVRPSRDPRARAKYLVTSSLGGLLLELSLQPDLDLADVGPTVRRLVEQITLPVLEIYTEGFLADSQYLDEYVRYTEESGDAPPAARPHKPSSEATS